MIKKTIYVLCLSLFVCVACSKDDPIQEEQTLQQENEIFSKGTKIKKLDVCHYDAVKDSWKTMSVDEIDLQVHLDHGDTSGACIKKLDVCHYDAVTDSWKTMSIDEIDLQVHLDHGDTAGACFKNNIPTVYNPITGRTWMDRNLGANSVAKSSTDVDGYGDLYQWGRGNDGHQLRTSSNTTNLSLIDQPGHSDFIVSPNSPRDWRNPQNDNLWQGVNGVNNPCPTGFRIPTSAEWEAELLSWSSDYAAGAFASPLKLTMAGYRRGSTGELLSVGSFGTYYSSTVDGGVMSGSLQFGEGLATANWSINRAVAFSCRCIKD